MEATKRLPCTCRNDFQDTQYGRGIRVHNWAWKKNAWRCTVCGKEKVGQIAEVKDSKA